MTRNSTSAPNGLAESGIELKPKDKMSVTVMASDKCDLAATPNIGSGDRYQLDVVTPEELLAMLERKELGLRRRLEQIIDELSEMRDSLSRIKRTTDGDRGSAPEDVPGRRSKPMTPPIRRWETRPKNGLSPRDCCALNGRWSKATNRPKKCWEWPPRSTISAKN